MDRSRIWHKVKEAKGGLPLYVLAPMEDVTDSVFRRIVADCARPDVFVTEFTSAEGMFSKGRSFVTQRLYYTEAERPLVAQIWGKTPENYFKAAKELVELGFDGVDINMGCPVEKIVAQGACSALIKNPSLVSEIIKATQEGAAGKIAVSVKTRIGFGAIETENWCGFLLGHKLDLLTVHGRIAKEMSKFPANWEEVGKVVALRKEISPETLIVGNGDIMNLNQADEMVEKHGVDGVMIGRGIFHNPYLFNRNIDFENQSAVEKLELLKKHVLLFDEVWSGKKNFAILKKFFKIYCNGFPNAGEIRNELMETLSKEDVLAIIDPILAAN